MINMQCGHA